MSEEIKKVSATLVPELKTANPRPFSHQDIYLGGENAPPSNHPWQKRAEHFRTRRKGFAKLVSNFSESYKRA